MIILEGRVEIVTDEHELQHINALYEDKYVAPRSGARATIFEKDCDLYQVRVKHVMAWEYGDIGTRTDWHFE